MPNNVKPIGRKAYGSIGHLPQSRMGPAPYDGNANYVCKAHLDDDAQIVDIYALASTPTEHPND